MSAICVDLLITVHNSLRDDFYIEQLKEFASCFGVEPEYIDLLHDNGFSVDEIEELLYEPDELLSYAEVLNYGRW